MRNEDIYKKAVDVLGNEGSAENWLSQPARGLNYHIPSEVMQSMKGEQEVYSLLLQLEYCVYI